MKTSEVLMLLEFKAKNYKSFMNEFTFSMVPAPKQKGLDYSILSEEVGNETYKGLCSAVIYGANASGKTNIIGAIETFKSIIVRGSIRNDTAGSVNAASGALELIPNNTLKESSPVTFSIKFIDNGMLFEYTLSMDIGLFLEERDKRKIVKELLKINNRIMFERDEDIQFPSLSYISEYLVNEFEHNKDGAIAIAKNNLDDEELFLMNGFRTMISSKITNNMLNWLKEKLMVVYRADSMNVVRRNDSDKNSIYIENKISEAAKIFGISSNELGYINDVDNNESRLCSIFGNEKKATAIPAEIFESYGTVRFINIFPLVMGALLGGGILIIDEFDASIHPMALMSVINMFHNDEININNAQLVFNTHNPIFLNHNIFRRDEIKFVERDDDTHFSTHYSLSDFGTAGAGGVRKGSDYMKNYFIDRYGAIKDVDFAPIFENVINKRNENERK